MTVKTIAMLVIGLFYLNINLMGQNSDFKHKYNIITTINDNCNLKKEKSPISDIILTLSKNDSIVLLECYDIYWLISTKSHKGYVHKMFISETDKIKSIKDEMKIAKDILKKKQKNTAKKKQLEQEIIKKKESLISRYGQEIARKILNKEFWLGMTSSMAIQSLGFPDKTNKSVGSWGTHEQWIYRSKDLNLYFENGKLTSWQN